MHHVTCGINSLLHSVNLIVLTLLLVHLILRISPHHSHHLRSHHLSLPRPFTPDLKLISFTNPFLHSHCYSFRTDFTVLNLYCTGVVCFSFFFWLRVLDKAEYSAFEFTLNSLSYRIVWGSLVLFIFVVFATTRMSACRETISYSPLRRNIGLHC